MSCDYCDDVVKRAITFGAKSTGESYDVRVVKSEDPFLGVLVKSKGLDVTLTPSINFCPMCGDRLRNDVAK